MLIKKNGKITLNFIYLFYVLIILFIIYIGIIAEYNNIKMKYYIIFGLGILSNTLILIDFLNLSNLKKILGNIGFSLIGLLPGKNEKEYNIYLHIFVVYVLFIVYFTIAFAKQIINKISEVSVFVITLGFWYLIYKNYFLNFFIEFLSVIYTVIGIIGTIFVINSIFTKENSDKNEIILYIWYILVLIYYGLLQINLGSISFFFNSGLIGNISFLDIFVSGMFFSYIFIYIVYLFQMLPIKFNKDDSDNDVKKRVLKFTGILNNKFDNLQLNSFMLIIILLLVIVFLFFDNFFLNLSDTTLISIFFLLSFVFDRVVLFYNNLK